MFVGLRRASLVIVLSCCTSAYAAVAALDSIANTNDAAVPANFTVSAGTGRVIVLAYTQEPFDGAKLSSIDLGGITSTKVSDYQSGSSGFRCTVTLFYWKESQISGFADAAFDNPVYAGSGPIDERKSWHVLSYEGVDQDSPIFHQTGVSLSTDDPITVDLNNKDESIAVAAVCEEAVSRAFDWSGGAGFTELAEETSSNHTSGVASFTMSSDSGASTASADQTGGASVGMAIAGIVLSPTVVAGGDSNRRR